MALTVTSLAAPFPKTSLTLIATAATGATVGGIYRVNGEIGFITKITGVSIEVRSRGSFGGAAVDHAVLSPLTFGLATDLAELGLMETVPVPTMDKDIVAIGADGVIGVPRRDTLFYITKGSALATSTFANPSATQDGLMVSFCGLTDFAHVITTVDVNDGTTGSHTTLTSPAFAGACLTLVAAKAKWLVFSNATAPWVIT